MKFIILFLLILTSGQIFCQSTRQKNKQLEIEINDQGKEIDSLLTVRSSLNDSICKLQYLNRTAIHWLVELYNETEEGKYRMFLLFDQTSDTLMDWNQFYRYETVSLDKLNVCKNELEFHFISESSMIDGVATYLSPRKRIETKERNGYLEKQIAFNARLITDLKNSLIELENQLAINVSDYLKLTYLKEVILKTKNYCSKKRKELEKKPRIVCGEGFLEAIASDSTKNDRKAKLISTDFDESAQFPGGFDSLKLYLEQSILYMDVPSGKPKGSMKTYVKFIVTDNGEIRNVIITKESGCISCDLLVEDIIQNMPYWRPATKAGHPVSSEFRLPVKIN